MPMNFRGLFIIAGLCLGFAGQAFAQKPDPATAKQQIEQVLADQAQAWNRGDVESFMDGYARTPDLRFATGGTVTRGWRETLDRYKQRYPRPCGDGHADLFRSGYHRPLPRRRPGVRALAAQNRQGRTQRVVHAPLSLHRRRLADRGGPYLGCSDRQLSRAAVPLDRPAQTSSRLAGRGGVTTGSSPSASST